MIILTLIATDRLTGSHVEHAIERAKAGLLPIDRIEWLEEGTACDIYVDVPRRHMVLDYLEDAMGDVDFVIQPDWIPRRRPLLVADMDSTMIQVECIDELADYAGLKAEVAAITERAMQGELDFEASLTARVALLAGLDEALIARCRKERVRLTPGATTLVRTMKANGATTILVSGGFTHFAEPIGAEIGFDRVVANRLEMADGKLTGRVIPPIVGAQTKRQALLDACAELGLRAGAALAIGDGANDVPMLYEVALGVAYHAKPAAKDASYAVIDHNDLTAVLYAQGIPKHEWIGG